jgi:hypothetical protein
MLDKNVYMEEVPNRKRIILTEATLTIDGLTLMGAMVANSLGGNAGSPASLTMRNSTFIQNQ